MSRRCSCRGSSAGHAEHLVVAALLVGHPEHADGAGLDQAAGERRLLDQHERVERVAVLAERVLDEAVVGRVLGGGEQRPVEADPAGLVVHLVLVALPLGDLDRDVELHRLFPHSDSGPPGLAISVEHREVDDREGTRAAARGHRRQRKPAGRAPARVPPDPAGGGLARDRAGAGQTTQPLAPVGIAGCWRVSRCQARGARPSVEGRAIRHADRFPTSQGRWRIAARETTRPSPAPSPSRPRLGLNPPRRPARLPSLPSPRKLTRRSLNRRRQPCGRASPSSQPSLRHQRPRGRARRPHLSPSSQPGLRRPRAGRPQLSRRRVRSRARPSRSLRCRRLPSLRKLMRPSLSLRSRPIAAKPASHVGREAEPVWTAACCVAARRGRQAAGARAS